ncbi:ATP-binding protein [Pleurocapsa sp. PCC 7319]|uniref:GAF domain-containing sensor histidine kinase n=1 Tax=Pleurocapsa sp. PCC 7319 TaxID=118161 RepID=UPI000346D4A9|nr:ATP-binding protein [Pleurocapsa sp. PCC 7319]
MSNNHISSTEFTTLCQSQMTLLNRSLGAIWSIVYLTEESTEDEQTQLFPFAIFPQTDHHNLSKLPAVELSEIWQQSQNHSLARLLPANFVSTPKLSPSEWKSESPERKQLILPLIYQENFLGLLVTGRKDREWHQQELTQIEEIASTLAIARFLELQRKWTQQELALQENLRRIEHDRLDDLLHQLRNPLTALRTFSKLLMKRLLPADRNLSIVKSILEQSDRFQELLKQFEAESEQVKAINSPAFKKTSVPYLETNDSLVNQSNFLLPSSNAEFEAVDLEQILIPLLKTAEAIAAERNIQLQSKIPQALPKITGDLAALREIFNNLIDNAFKYTPAGGKVELDIQTKQLKTNSKMLGVVIRDTGYGIPSKDQERIFERHYRGVQAESSIPGTGLGLAIAQELVIKMQGEIELISPNNLLEDRPGTTFIVWLPISIDN